MTFVEAHNVAAADTRPDPSISEHGTHEIPMPPIATYHESRFNRNCEFELYSDSIRVFGRNGYVKFDTTFKLSQLDPNLERLWIHQPAAIVFGLFFMFGLVALWVFAVGLNRGLSDPMSVAAGADAVFFFVLALATGRMIELARFRSDAGVPLLDIGRAGKRRAEFDGFVSAVAERVAAAKVTP